MTDTPFCEAFWFVDHHRHACLYRTGHAGSCWCCAPEDGYPGGDLSVIAPTPELDRLRIWKAEALLVLAEWEQVWQAAGRPGPLGSSKARAVAELLNRKEPGWQR